MFVFTLACAIVLVVAGIVDLCTLRSDRRAAWYLIGLGLFNGLTTSVNTLEAVSSVAYGTVLGVLCLCIVASGGLMIDACQLAYERGHPFVGFVVATALALSVLHIVLVTHVANYVTLTTIAVEGMVALMLGGHLFRLNEPSKIPEVYRQRENVH